MPTVKEIKAELKRLKIKGISGKNKSQLMAMMPKEGGMFRKINDKINKHIEDNDEERMLEKRIRVIEALNVPFNPTINQKRADLLREYEETSPINSSSSRNANLYGRYRNTLESLRRPIASRVYETNREGPSRNPQERKYNIDPEEKERREKEREKEKKEKEQKEEADRKKKADYEEKLPELKKQRAPLPTDRCQICFDDLGDDPSLLASACRQGHVFHKSCLKDYEDNHKGKTSQLKCPLCQIPFKYSPVNMVDGKLLGEGKGSGAVNQKAHRLHNLTISDRTIRDRINNLGESMSDYYREMEDGIDDVFDILYDNEYTKYRRLAETFSDYLNETIRLIGVHNSGNGKPIRLSNRYANFLRNLRRGLTLYRRNNPPEYDEIKNEVPPNDEPPEYPPPSYGSGKPISIKKIKAHLKELKVKGISGKNKEQLMVMLVKALNEHRGGGLGNVAQKILSTLIHSKLFHKVMEKFSGIGDSEHYHGSGPISWVKNAVNVIKNPTASLTVEPKQVRDCIAKYGHHIVRTINVCRVPINGVIKTALNAITLGKFSKQMANNSYDKMFHLYALLFLDNGMILLTERNQRVVLKPASNSEKKAKEHMSVVCGKTLKELFDNAVKLGGSKIWRYDPIENNCQGYVSLLLKGSNIFNSGLNNFVNQKVEKLLEGKSHKFATKITDIANLAENVVRGGKEVGSSRFIRNIIKDDGLS